MWSILSSNATLIPGILRFSSGNMSWLLVGSYRLLGRKLLVEKRDAAPLRLLGNLGDWVVFICTVSIYIPKPTNKCALVKSPIVSVEGKWANIPSYPGPHHTPIWWQYPKTIVDRMPAFQLRTFWPYTMGSIHLSRWNNFFSTIKKGSLPAICSPVWLQKGGPLTPWRLQATDRTKGTCLASRI